MTDECLSEEVLLDLLEGRATVEAPTISEHLDGCPPCRQLLAALVAREDDAASPAPLPAGTHLGRYRVIEVIGAGATGLVYAAVDPQLGRKVALKLMRPLEGTSSAEGHARLLREARALARLSHPNVVAVHDVGEAGDRVFIAMDLLEGGTLAGWLGKAPRRWTEVVAAFAKAGDGLMAAHAVGLVHRDFKPDNVLVGTGGEVRVTDFGLARWEQIDSAAAPHGADVGHASVELTRTGALVGTPAFMAPEQLAGKMADARSDQFSFCVSLYWALYGERPYAGETAEELSSSIGRRQVRAAPRGRRVPGRIRRVLLRGLHPDPARRWESMSNLLRELRRAPRRTLAAVAGLLAMAFGAALAAFWIGRGSPPCRDAGEGWSGVWGPARTTVVRAAFVRTGRPDAERVFQGLDHALTRYGQAWSAMRTAACVAARVRREQSEALLDLRMTCLEDRRQKVDQLVQLFESADAALIDRAVPAASGLPDLDACANTPALAAVLPPPREPSAREALARLSGENARAYALWLAGRYQEGLAVIRGAIPGAVTLGYPPLTAQLRFREGGLLERYGASAESERVLLEAAALAQEGHDDGTAFDAWLILSWSRLQNRDSSQARAFGRLAEASLARLGSDPLREVDLLQLRGQVAGVERRWDDKLALARRAAAILEDLGRTDGYQYEEAVNLMGEAHQGQGRLEEALEDYRRSVELRERLFGPDARDLGGALLDQARIERLLGRVAEALTHATRGMAIRAKSTRFDAIGRAEFAYALRAAGRYREALEVDQRAVADAEAQGGQAAWRASFGLLGEGMDLIALQRAREAISVLERAAALRAKDQPPDREVLFPLARALWEGGGDRARARALARAAADQARPEAERYGSVYEAELSEIQEWLAARRE